MKKSIAKSHTVKTVSAYPFSNVLTLMGENLVAWRKSPAASPTGEREQCIEKCLVIGREAYRLMAIKLLWNRDDLDALDTAKDIAQECTSKLVNWVESGCFPFNEGQIDMLLAEAKRDSKPLTGNRSPMNALLYTVFFFGANDQVRRIKKRLKRQIGGFDECDMYDDNHEHVIRQGSVKPQRSGRMDGGLWVFNDDKVLRDVIKWSRVGRAVEIHDAYLDCQIYERQPLRKVLGSWTPMIEWLGHCTKADRPPETAIPMRTLQAHIKAIKDMIRCDMTKTSGSASAPNWPHL